jgi:hypothetical protein
MIARNGGQPTCAVTVKDKTFIGIYIKAILSEYNAREPFKFKTNPRELPVNLYDAPYHQTRPDGVATDGQLAFFSTQSDYARPPSGALTIIDPARDNKIDIYPNLIEGQNLGPLAYDPGSKLLWGGTNRWGQVRATPPTQPTALIYGFDPAKRKVVTTIKPWPEADLITILGSPRDGVVVATKDGTACIEIDTIAKTTKPLKLPAPFPKQIRRGSDGNAYFLAADRLYRWSTRAGGAGAVDKIDPIAEAPGCTLLTEPQPGTWLLADATSIYRIQLPAAP